VKPFLTTNFTLDTSKKMLDNTKALLECCRGYLPYTNGRYALKLEAAVSTSGLFEVDDHMIIGSINFAGGNKSNTYNRCEVSFSNQNDDYETDIRTYSNATHLAEDESEVLELKHNSPGITDPDRAYDQARLLVERSRLHNKTKIPNDFYWTHHPQSVAHPHHHMTCTQDQLNHPQDLIYCIHPTSPRLYQ